MVIKEEWLGVNNNTESWVEQCGLSKRYYFTVWRRYDIGVRNDRPGCWLVPVDQRYKPAPDEELIGPYDTLDIAKDAVEMLSHMGS